LIIFQIMLYWLQYTERKMHYVPESIRLPGKLQEELPCWR